MYFHSSGGIIYYSFQLRGLRERCGDAGKRAICADTSEGYDGFDSSAPSPSDLPFLGEGSAMPRSEFHRAND